MLRFVKLSLVLVILAAVAAAGLGAWAWTTLHRPMQAGSYPVDFEVASGQSVRAILEHLVERGVIPDARVARLYLALARDDAPLQAGEYRFDRPSTTVEVLERLIRGEVMVHPVTILEGWTLEETAQHLARLDFGDEAELLEAMRSGALIHDLDPAAGTLEGYLFPDTYTFARATPAARIVETMVANFRRRWQDRVVVEGGAALDVRATVTLASIVESEARLDAERPIIASVYRNRLDRGIGLYADPTVIFALKQLGSWDGNLRRDDLTLDSPYNTYRYPGLPPGPICSPGLSSLIAAVRPTETDYLYFVSRNDGSHVFSETLGEHNRNVEQWQRRYWRDRWRREREEASLGARASGP
jgi:UPF0755 protein